MSPLAPLVHLAFVVLFELMFVVPGAGGEALDGSHHRGVEGRDGFEKGSDRMTDGARERLAVLRATAF